ncbi:lysophospholipase L1-like esterase [Undibacterium sp. GrIS 1.8]|uniref:SGNH/GDSL hydrolase family protein n=1 Tax=unclassified Undibacterium TaxID=2630295 RepID=UPI003395F5CB
MFPYLAELLALPLYPLLSWQGKRTRETTPRLPEAGGARFGISHYQPELGYGDNHADRNVDGDVGFRLLSIGESPVAGVGVANQNLAITAQLAKALASRLKTDVSWQAIGKNGADIASAIQHLLPQLFNLADKSTQIDLVFVAFGVNDTTAFRSDQRYRAELCQLLAAIQQQLAPKQILLSGVPPVHAFPALPQPLRFVLGSKAKALDLVAKKLVSQLGDGRGNVSHIPMALDISDASLMAEDGYHPSAKGTKAWAEQLVAARYGRQLQ